MANVDETGLKAEFESYDADGSGTIDESEFTALVASLGIRMTPEQIQTAFLAIDIDGNGRIDFREFRSWWLRFAKA